MVTLVTYANEIMSISKAKCCGSALKHGIDYCLALNTDSISDEFTFFNPVLKEQRGCGYWLWKPYIIYRSMLSCGEDDILVYSDSGIEFVNSVNHIIDKMDEDIFFFTNGFPHEHWCKGDVIDSIIPSLRPLLYKQSDKWVLSPQVQASVIFFKVNQKTKDFVKEWLLYCQMPGFIDDSPSKLSNHAEFAEHRHDQAILTCLQIKYGYKLHFWPTNYSEHIRHTAQPGDNYPTIFNHHRKRNEEWK